MKRLPPTTAPRKLVNGTHIRTICHRTRRPAWRLNRDACRTAAAAIGVATSQIATILLDDPAVDRLRTVGRLLRLGERYGAGRLEAACQRAIQFGEPSYVTVKRILLEGLDEQPVAGAGERHATGAYLCPHPVRTVGPSLSRCKMELNHQLTPYLTKLRLSGILQTLDARSRQAIDGQWSYTEFLSRLLEDEVERRAQKQLTLRLRRSTANSTKTLETFDFAFNPTVNRQQVLQLASCDFIRQHRNILICGPTGTGKTHLAQSLVHEACRQGFDALFISVAKLLQHINGGTGGRQRGATAASLSAPGSAGPRRFRAQAVAATRPKRLVRHY